MEFANIRNIKSELVSSHIFALQGKYTKSIHIPKDLRWVTDIQQIPHKNLLFKAAKRKTLIKETSVSKSKQSKSRLTLDISQLQKSKDILIKKQQAQTERDTALLQIKSLNKIQHSRYEGDVQLRKTNICFKIKKTNNQKSQLYKNRKMSLPTRSGPIITTKTKRRQITNENNNMFAGSLITHRLQRNHPEVNVRKVSSQNRPLTAIMKCQTQVHLSKRPKQTFFSKVKQNDFQIKPWQERDNSLEQIIV